MLSKRVRADSSKPIHSEVITKVHKINIINADNKNDIIKNIVVRNQDHSMDNQVDPVDGDTGLGNQLEIGDNALYQPILYENTQTGRERINKYIINIISLCNYNCIDSRIISIFQKSF